MNDNRVSIVDVAEYAGVSTATVGRVVGGYGTVSIKMRERVMSAISALGYSPNVVAQGLRSKKTKTIAVIVGSVSNSFFASMVSAIEEEAAQHGYNVIICNTNEDPDVEIRHIVNLQARMVDGIILSSAFPQTKFTEEKAGIYRSGTPIVLVDRRVDGLDLDIIESDNTAAGYKTTNYLLALGHRKIGILGTGDYSTITDRIEGYKKALSDRKIEFVERRVMKPTRNKNLYYEKELNKYFLCNKDLTAIMLLNNSLAEIVMLLLEKLDFYDKRNFSIVCWDDAGMNKLIGLTTLLQFPEEIGRVATQQIIKRIESKTSLEPQHIIIDSELKIRSSCKPL